MSLRMNSKPLPEGWIEKKLEEICLIKHGFAFKSQFFTFEESDYVLLTPGSFYESGGYREQGEKTKYYIGKIPNGFILKKGDFLFAMTEQAPGLLGSPLIVPESNRFLHNQRLGLVQVFDGIDWHNDFFFHLFNTQEFRAAVQSSASGVKVRHTSPSKLGAISIRFPPTIAEQKAIADNLNEAFEGIDRAIANTEKNLANIGELFKSSLQFVFSNQGQHWIRLQLSELLERKWITSHLDGNHGGDYPKKDEFVNIGVPYISANCLKNESVDMSLAKYLTPERANLLRKGIAQNNDVLFAHNATVGPVAVLRTNERKVILSTSLTYYRCDPKFIIPEYLALYMRSNEFKSQYEAVMRQSTRNQVPITKQRTFYHLIPPIKEQQKIANHLNDLFVETQRLETIYRKKIAALNELKQSILQKAFTGELTADTANQTAKVVQEVSAA